MYTRMEEPLGRVDETLRLFGDVAAAIADCDEKHPVSLISLVGVKANKADGPSSPARIPFDVRNEIYDTNQD